MNKFRTTISSLLAAVAMLSLIPQVNAQTPTEIPIRQGENVNGGPRMPAMVPIRACVFGDTIYLSFSADLGDVDVELCEESEGVVLQTSVDSSYLSATLPFSGDAGEYTISFTLASGAVYEGMFSI